MRTDRGSLREEVRAAALTGMRGLARKPGQGDYSGP